jgi:wyosine [tRNA(Phe)-imidazoG37] synthetase (radical SAM superfamily)
MQKSLLLSQEGRLYRREENTSEIVPETDFATNPALMQVRKNPFQHFFKTPYHSAAYVVDSEIKSSIRIHPSSFYPGSPFDTFKAMEMYYTEQRLEIPRFYLYPSGLCNSRCPICQFYTLDRFGQKPAKERVMPYAAIERIVYGIGEIGSNLNTIAVNVSGDGEPTEHPEIARILDLLREGDMEIFLTSNLRLPRDREGSILQAISDSVAMITVSIKGLNDEAYDQYQGTHGKKEFKNVLSNLEKLLESLGAAARRDDVLVGVASLLLPENTESYQGAVQRFVDMGIDYLYLNPVEPSYAKWNITFTEDQVSQTNNFLRSLSTINCGSTLIRYPSNLRLGDPNKNVYFDASKRDNPEVCGSALWNPTFITTDTNGRIGARVLSCRSSANFGNSDFWFIDGWTGKEGTLDSLLSGLTNDVMKSAADCQDCRLERHVLMFDRAISIMKQNGFKGDFYLEFEEDNLEARGRAISFEETK